KNLTHGGILAAIFLVVAVIIAVILHIGPMSLLTVVVGFFAVMVIQLGAGNVISVHWPKRIELTQMGSKMSSNAAGLASLAVMMPLSALVGVIAFATWYWKAAWLPLLCGVIILAVSLKLYSYVLDWAARYTWEHIEQITGNLGA